MSGEFAGYALDEAIDAENDRWLYRQGVMSDAQAFELGIIDHMGRYNHVSMFPVGARAKASVKTCRHCVAGGLSWISTGKGWRLALDGALHICAQYKR
jgi:hypothetical protein